MALLLRVLLHSARRLLVLGVLSLTGCGAANNAVEMSGAGMPNTFTSGSAGSSAADPPLGSAGGGATAGGGGSATAGGGGRGSGGGGNAADPNGGAPSGPSSSRLVARPVGSVVGATSGFWEYVPPHYGNGARYPLLVFWHGLGENGDGTLASLDKVTANGPPRLLKEDRWPEDRKFVLLSPQHPGTDCPSSKEIDDFIRFAIAHYDVDLARVYLSGLSCGAIGSWAYLGDHLNEVVAAAVLVCGDGRRAFAKAGCALGRVPIWALHGELDPTVAPAGSIEPLTQLIACSSPPAVAAKLTVYPGVAHDSWTRTFDLSAGNDVYGWLLSHSKP
ncbi:MAG: hypothetical protein WDO74_01050 [Pseudomonadota bacterium]